MSDKNGKTEQATPRRLKEARDEGQIARSQEVAVALSLLSALIVGLALGPAVWKLWREQLTMLLSLQAGEGELRAILTGSAVRMTIAVVPAVAVAGAFAGFVSNVAQVGLKARPKAARPKLSRVSPKNGLQRLKPSTSLWELGRTSAKLALVTGVVWAPLRSWQEQVDDGWTFASGLSTTGGVLRTIFVRVIAVSLLVAAADYAWNRRKMNRDLRMSKDEVKRDVKEQAGDPMLRSRRSQRARELSRNRMMASVAHADVVVTNPTHLAVALRYVPSEPAPRVVAKGADRAAARIRADARRHGVMVTENVPLARALYRRAKVGDFVPQALFEAVALVLAMVYRRRASAAAATAGVLR